MTNLLGKISKKVASCRYWKLVMSLYSIPGFSAFFSAAKLDFVLFLNPADWDTDNTLILKWIWMDPTQK